MSNVKKQNLEYFVIIPTNDWRLGILSNSVIEIERFLKRKRKRYKIFYGTNIKRKDLEIILKQYLDKKGTIIYYGHGCRCGESLYGEYEYPLIDYENVYLFRNKIAYIAACHSCRYLGKKAIQNGCTAYLGYSDILWVPSIYSNRLRVVETINKGLEMLIDGHKVEEVKTFIYNGYAGLVRSLRKSKKLGIQIYLELNMEHLSLKV